jgi:hypothetical protein
MTTTGATARRTRISDRIDRIVVDGAMFTVVTVCPKNAICDKCAEHAVEAITECFEYWGLTATAGSEGHGATARPITNR